MYVFRPEHLAEGISTLNDVEEVISRYETCSTKSKIPQHHEKCSAVKIPTYNLPQTHPSHIYRPRVPSTVKARLERQAENEIEENYKTIKLIDHMQMELAQSLNPQNTRSEKKNQARIEVQELSAQEDEFSEGHHNQNQNKL